MAIDYGPNPTLPADQLTRLAELAHRQLDFEDAIAATEQKLQLLQIQHQQVSEVDIPTLLDATGLSDVRLSNGIKVTVREDVRVSVSGKWRDPINAWLVNQGHDDLIKDKVTADFGKGESDLAEKAIALLTSAGVARINRTRAVNAQTFAALIRELRAAGEDVPYDQLGVFVQKHAKLERPS
jgi:hypothetical protein